MTSLIPSSLVKSCAWDGAHSSIWPASCFILHRNLADHHFPSKLSEKEMLTLLTPLKESLLHAEQLKNPLFLPAEKLSGTDKEFLFERFVSTESFQSLLPGQGFVIDDSCTFLGLINIQDHLQLHLIDTSGDWQASWKMLTALDHHLTEKHPLAFSQRFGYLTADFGLCGTSLLAMSYLHLPALIHTAELHDALLKHSAEEIEATGLEGTLSEPLGDIVILRNRYTLGTAEEGLLRALHTSAMNLTLAEKSARAQIVQKENPQIKDLILRAYGLLLHSYQLHIHEALGALSMLKLALDLGWAKGISDADINQLFFQCERGHLSFGLDAATLDATQIAHKRADLLQKKLKDVTIA